MFDTVYVSLYKGLGGLAGCCLAGAGTSAGATPSICVVELTVGDATLGFAPEEVAGIVEQLVS